MRLLLLVIYGIGFWMSELGVVVGEGRVFSLGNEEGIEGKGFFIR